MGFEYFYNPKSTVFCFYVNNIIEDEKGNRLFKTREGTAKEAINCHGAEP